ncbi:MAG: 16S rRNA (guanine(527)-N(7))-methyltransferase RsmG [Tepidisphaeraceae bacterium]
MPELWSQLAARADVALSASQHALLDRYLDLLLAANEKMNLTRITERSAAEVRHVGDALTLLPFLPRRACRIADVGSGGGVPGIPLAIVRPDALVTLIESTKKKAAFLTEAAKEIDLKNVRVLDCRAEAVRESFDIVTARAIGSLEQIAEWCLPLVKKNGTLLAMKGPKVQDELPAARRIIRRLGGAAPLVHPVELPGIENHVIVEIRRDRP